MALTPIKANLIGGTGLSVLAYNDGNISFGAFSSSSSPVICAVCASIIQTVGAKNGVYVARPYPLQIYSGNKVVFTVPSLIFGTKSTMNDGYSDIEVILTKSFTGQVF